jgi:hypothetical protein
MPFYIIIIIISFFVSLLGLLVRENRTLPMVLFPFFLFLTSAVEYAGWKLSQTAHHTLLLYNLFSCFEFTFYLFFFTYIVKKEARKILFLVLPLYLIITMLNIFFFEGKSGFHGYTYMLGCMLVVVFSISYFYFLFRFPDTGSLAKNPFFWIGIALLFYYTCSFSLYGLQNYIIKTMTHYDKVLEVTGDILNILLYTLFSIGFLCKINIRRLLGLS